MSAAKENRRPTLATRLTRMVRSSYWTLLIASELQSLAPGRIGQRRHPAVEGEAATVEDHPGDADVLGAGGDQPPHGLGARHVTRPLAELAPQVGFGGGGGD